MSFLHYLPLIYTCLNLTSMEWMVPVCISIIYLHIAEFNIQNKGSLVLGDNTSIVDFFPKKGKFYNTCIENRNKEFLDYI